MKKNIVSIIGIDSFEKKNINQARAVNAAGLTVHVVSTDNYGVSSENLGVLGEVFVLRRNFVYRFFQVLFYFTCYARKIRHAEIYPGGRFAFLYVIIAKIFLVKIIVVERGDLYYYDSAGAVARLSQRLCYRYADLVWYREYYPGMDVESRLRRLGARETVFIHNAIDVAARDGLDRVKGSYGDRDIDFLWVNTLKDFRHPDWFVSCLLGGGFSGKKAVLMGVDKGIVGAAADRHHEIVGNVNSQSIEIKERGNPDFLYPRAKYFVLASDLVFLNNALLEAMSYGAVPIVSDVEGARLVVDDGLSGYVFENSIDGLRGCMRRAVQESAESWKRLSEGAEKKVLYDFSLEKWNAKYMDMICSLWGR